METFFSEADYREYLQLMAEWCNRCKVHIWSYCLMPNHVHLIATPESEDDHKVIRSHERTGRPLGDERFIDHLEQLTSRLLRKKRPGPKKTN